MRLGGKRFFGKSTQHSFEYVDIDVFGRGEPLIFETKWVYDRSRGEDCRRNEPVRVSFWNVWGKSTSCAERNGRGLMGVDSPASSQKPGGNGAEIASKSPNSTDFSPSHTISSDDGKGGLANETKMESEGKRPRKLTFADEHFVGNERRKLTEVFVTCNDAAPSPARSALSDVPLGSHGMPSSSTEERELTDCQRLSRGLSTDGNAQRIGDMRPRSILRKPSQSNEQKVILPPYPADELAPVDVVTVTRVASSATSSGCSGEGHAEEGGPYSNLEKGSPCDELEVEEVVESGSDEIQEVHFLDQIPDNYNDWEWVTTHSTSSNSDTLSDRDFLLDMLPSNTGLKTLDELYFS